MARLRDGITRWSSGAGVGVDLHDAGLGDAGPVVQAKAQPGATLVAPADGRVAAGLGAGRSLDAGVASRMGSVLGDSFDDVRIHTNAHAGRVASDLHARAFTVEPRAGMVAPLIRALFVLLALAGCHRETVTVSVEEVATRPERWAGRPLRVTGAVVAGSSTATETRGDYTHYRFRIAQGGNALHVEFVGVVPDTLFSLGSRGTFVGTLASDGGGWLFRAIEIEMTPMSYRERRAQEQMDAAAKKMLGSGKE